MTILRKTAACALAGALFSAGAAVGGTPGWQNPVGEMVFICVKDNVERAPLTAPARRIAEACARGWGKLPMGCPHPSNVYCSFLLGDPIKSEITPRRYAEVLMKYRREHPRADTESYSEWALEAQPLLVRPATAWLAAARKFEMSNPTQSRYVR